MYIDYIYTYSQEIFDKVIKTCHCAREHLQQVMLDQMEIYIEKKTAPYITSHIKTNSNCIIDQSVKSKL